MNNSSFNRSAGRGLRLTTAAALACLLAAPAPWLADTDQQPAADEALLDIAPVIDLPAQPEQAPQKPDRKHNKKNDAPARSIHLKPGGGPGELPKWTEDAQRLNSTSLAWSRPRLGSTDKELRVALRAVISGDSAAQTNGELKVWASVNGGPWTRLDLGNDDVSEYSVTIRSTDFQSPDSIMLRAYALDEEGRVAVASPYDLFDELVNNGLEDEENIEDNEVIELLEEDEETQETEPTSEQASKPQSEADTRVAPRGPFKRFDGEPNYIRKEREEGNGPEVATVGNAGGGGGGGGGGNKLGSGSSGGGGAGGGGGAPTPPADEPVATPQPVVTPPILDSVNEEVPELVAPPEIDEAPKVVLTPEVDSVQEPVEAAEPVIEPPLVVVAEQQAVVEQQEEPAPVVVPAPAPVIVEEQPEQPAAETPEPAPAPAPVVQEQETPEVPAVEPSPPAPAVDVAPAPEPVVVIEQPQEPESIDEPIEAEGPIEPEAPAAQEPVQNPEPEAPEQETPAPETEEPAQTPAPETVEPPVVEEEPVIVDSPIEVPVIVVEEPTQEPVDEPAEEPTSEPAEPVVTETPAADTDPVIIIDNTPSEPVEEPVQEPVEEPASEPSEPAEPVDDPVIIVDVIDEPTPTVPETPGDNTPDEPIEIDEPVFAPTASVFDDATAATAGRVVGSLIVLCGVDVVTFSSDQHVTVLFGTPMVDGMVAAPSRDTVYSDLTEHLGGSVYTAIPAEFRDKPGSFVILRTSPGEVDVKLWSRATDPESPDRAVMNWNAEVASVADPAVLFD